MTWGSMLHLSLQAAELLAEEDIEVEVIDLRTLLPFDAKTCIQSVMRTCRLIIVQESQWSGGLGHTLQSRIPGGNLLSLGISTSCSRRN